MTTEIPTAMSYSARPDWVHCIRDYLHDRAWCGRDGQPFFVDIEHAALLGRSGGRQVACRECVAAITAALANGHDDPKYPPPTERPDTGRLGQHTGRGPLYWDGHKALGQPPVTDQAAPPVTDQVAPSHYVLTRLFAEAEASTSKDKFYDYLVGFLSAQAATHLGKDLAAETFVGAAVVIKRS